VPVADYILASRYAEPGSRVRGCFDKTVEGQLQVQWMVWWKPAGRAGCVVGQPMRSCVPSSESSWRSVTSLAAVYAIVGAFCMHATHMMAAFADAVYVTVHFGKCQ